ncbi:MAG: TIGR01440 family protein [Eubacteriales bacterium]|nr:TIGR01440 family protein [Clostridiales bacterium]MDD7774277.1 TIGR01440 family protein [Eubacteriales bacterium]MDY3942434.1 TIGR01440 family protein [Eubacteriales bacterium]
MELLEIQGAVQAACEALLDAAKLSAGDILVVGCSSSEILGGRIGTYSSPEVGKAVFDGLMEVLTPRGIYLAAQCCEHLNRSLIVEKAALPGVRGVNVIPQPKAGGSFATAAYHGFAHPMAIEGEGGIADAGMDIGGTLIGMHLKPVAVPVRLPMRTIGEAVLIAARTRLRFVGGSRAVYDEDLL